MPGAQRVVLLVARLTSGAAGLCLAYIAAFPLARGLGLGETDTSPAVLLAVGVLAALPAGALLWFAGRGRIGVWSDHA